MVKKKVTRSRAGHKLAKPKRKTQKHISVKQIDNGWLITTSHTDAAGNYNETAVFSKTEPKFMVAKA